jgi:hypothetical protein
MTTAEMNRRLDTLRDAEIAEIRTMIRQGFGARGIKAESTYTLKQINAVFEYHYDASGYGKRLP